MAKFGLGTRSTITTLRLRPLPNRIQPRLFTQNPRFLQTFKKPPDVPHNFAFAFDIDGVLLRSAKPLPRAQHALAYLQKQNIPFILLTNGGGKSEEERVRQLSRLLGVHLDTSMFVQSHTPFAELARSHGEENLKDKCVLVVGGEEDNCRNIAHRYGFTNVLIPSDIINAHPPLWPFVSLGNHKPWAQPLPPQSAPFNGDNRPPDDHPAVKVDAIMVFNDPRDWALDTQLILDLLLSTGGHLGTLSPKNGDPTLPNQGYQQDGQPALYFSNPDLFWASSYHLPRLGQGGFQAALEGVFDAVTGGPEKGVQLQKTLFGKPTQGTFEFAEKKLQQHRIAMRGSENNNDDNDDNANPLRTVYMVGDNPESDIRGANEYRSKMGSKWRSILVRTGVYRGTGKRFRPDQVVQDVWDAVQWGLRKEGVEVRKLY